MQYNHNRQKKIAVINDMAGFGRCALSVSMPIISAMKVQCCPIPTAIFSNHSAFESFMFKDMTDSMQSYVDEWKKIGLTFNGICSGFMGSKEQIDLVIRFIKEFSTPDTTVIIDPIMGDNGKTYATYTPQMCQEMKKMVAYADILTPNLTESCILTDTPYHDGKWKKKELEALAEKLGAMGPKKIVITGIPQGEFIANYCHETGKEPKLLRTHKVGTSRPGTGDVFASIIAADAVNGVDFQVSVKKASNFVKKCILRSMEMELPITDGVCFEEVLDKLR